MDGYRSIWRKGAGVLVAAAAVLSSAGCDRWVGDSLSFLAAGRIVRDHPGTVVDAGLGRATHRAGWLDVHACDEAVRLAVEAMGPGDLLTVECGTNNLWDFSYGGPAWQRAEIERLLALVPPDMPLVWVNVYTHDTTSPEAPARAVEFNTLLAEVLADRPATEIVDWYAWAAAHPEHLPDGTHPDVTGLEQLVWMVTLAQERLGYG